MSELKTLKEVGGSAMIVVKKSELRAEAVKWVKELRGRLYADETHYSVKWIQKFFNLTEEELKE